MLRLYRCTACTADVEYEENLKYFLEFGVQPGDDCDYLLVVQEVGACTMIATGVDSHACWVFAPGCDAYQPKPGSGRVPGVAWNGTPAT